MYPPRSAIGPAAKRNWLLVALNILIPCGLAIFVPLTYVAMNSGANHGVMFCGGLSLMLLASLGIINIRIPRLADGLPLLFIHLVGFTIAMTGIHQIANG